MRMILPLALLFALAAAGCGGPDTEPPEPSGPSATRPDPTETQPDPTETPAPPPARKGSLTPRPGDVRLAVGDTAPEFDGLPDGKVIVLFYRGHW